MSSNGRCYHCGGGLYFDELDKVWVCYNCARQQPQQVGVASKSQPIVSEIVDKSAPVTPEPIKEARPKPLPQPLVAQPKETPKVQEKRPKPAEKAWTYSYALDFSSNGYWYAPHEITFRREHMVFLIQHLQLLLEGVYPPTPIGTGYTDAQHRAKKTIPHRAYFESPVQFAAEVSARLERCGLDGLLLEAVYCWQKSPEYLERCFGWTYHVLAKRVKSALRYISGWERKKETYTEFRHSKRKRTVTA